MNKKKNFLKDSKIIGKFKKKIKDSINKRFEEFCKKLRN